MELVEKKLGDREWFEGDEPSVCDLMLMEVVDQFEMMTQGEWLKDHPSLQAHCERTKAIPRIKDYKESNRFFEGPFNGPAIMVNNVPANYWDSEQQLQT